MTEAADQAPINIFYLCHEKDGTFLAELKKHLSTLQGKGLINELDISLGADMQEESNRHIDNAQIILLLISPDLINNKYYYEIAIPRALRRQRSGEARVVPIILRPGYYEIAPFANLQKLPLNGKPINDRGWGNHDAAWTEVVKELSKVIIGLSNTSQLHLTSPDKSNAHHKQLRSTSPGQLNAPSKKKRLPVQLKFSLSALLNFISTHRLITTTVVTAVIAAIIITSFLFLQNNHSIIPSNTINTQNLSLQLVPVGGDKLYDIGITLYAKNFNVIPENPLFPAEQCIDNENDAVNKPFIVIIAVTTLDATQNDRNTSWKIGNEELQALCQWQKQYTPQIPIKIFVANIGTKETKVLNVTVPKVTEQIISFANANKNFAGVVGFSFSGSLNTSVQGSVAMQKLNDAHIPVISPAASGSDFSNKWPYFYRIIPDNKTEGWDAADYALNDLHAESAYVISDGKNLYSATLGQAFNETFAGSKHVTPIAYTVGQSLDSFKSIAKSIASSISTNPVEPTVIFCSCYADDLNNLLNALPPRKVGTNISIMGGEALYELGSYKNNYANIYFTAFAYPDTGTIESLCQHLCTTEQMQFSTMYCLSRGTPLAQCDGKKYGISRPGPHTIQTYDALNALVQAYKNVPEGNTTREKLRDALSILKFEGISGWINFNNSQSPSDPKNKIVLVLCVSSKSNAHLVYRYGQFIDPTLVSSNTNANVNDCQDK